MTAALYDEVVTVAPARKLTVVRDVETTKAPAPKKATPRANPQPVVGDPLVEGATRLLSIPLRHLYAALLRAGVLEIQA
ncbi:Rv1535 family protein [Mycobacterium sp. HNNTM2301]|uniref:Rv1535 family protein n=1 Tax=Mycobacterium hainanense TaxID=3289775 RepID=UPI0035A59BF5